MNIQHDIHIAKQIGSYGDAVEVPAGARWLFTSGTPGMTVDGRLPTDIEGQTELAWTHILEMLRRAGMGLQDIVKVTQYLRSPDDIRAYAGVRQRMLQGARPASMLLAHCELVRPEFLVEVEVVAARA